MYDAKSGCIYIKLECSHPSIINAWRIEMVEMNLESPQENNMIWPILCFTTQPGTHIHLLLISEKSRTDIFSKCFHPFPALLGLQLILSLKTKSKNSIASDFIQFNSCKIDSNIISMDFLKRTCGAGENSSFIFSLCQIFSTL